MWLKWRRSTKKKKAELERQRELEQRELEQRELEQKLENCKNHYRVLQTRFVDLKRKFKNVQLLNEDDQPPSTEVHRMIQNLPLPPNSVLRRDDLALSPNKTPKPEWGTNLGGKRRTLKRKKK